MDVATLAKDLATFLAPFLPFLLKVGEKAAEEAGKKVGTDAWHLAKSLWGKLLPKVEPKPAAQGEARSVFAAPNDEDARVALYLQLAKLFAGDEALAREMARLWDEAKKQGATVIASAEHSVAIGGDVSGSTIIVGDRNIVNP